MKAAGLGLLCLVLALAPITTPAIAQQPTPACRSVTMLTRELAPWSNPVERAAAVSAPEQASLNVGEAAQVTLRPTPEVRYLSTPGKLGDASSFGGMVSFSIAEPGTYRIALGASAWIDVVGAGSAVTSINHSRGPDCSGIRKMVDFPLGPGRYTLQIVGSGTPRIEVLIARVP